MERDNYYEHVHNELLLWPLNIVIYILSIINWIIVLILFFFILPSIFMIIFYISFIYLILWVKIWMCVWGYIHFKIFNINFACVRINLILYFWVFSLIIQCFQRSFIIQHYDLKSFHSNLFQCIPEHSKSFFGSIQNHSKAFECILNHSNSLGCIHHYMKLKNASKCIWMQWNAFEWFWTYYFTKILLL